MSLSCTGSPQDERKRRGGGGREKQGERGERQGETDRQTDRDRETEAINSFSTPSKLYVIFGRKITREKRQTNRQRVY